VPFGSALIRALHKHVGEIDPKFVCALRQNVGEIISAKDYGFRWAKWLKLAGVTFLIAAF